MNGSPIAVSIDDGAAEVEVVLSLVGDVGSAALTPEAARDLARRLVAAATAADKVNSERILRRHRRALRFEV